VLRQAQAGEPFPLSVPVAVILEGTAEPVLAEVGSCEAHCSLSIPCATRPLRVDVDPAFDVMRRLHPLEVPPALSTLFGADDRFASRPAPEDELVGVSWPSPGRSRSSRA
jgi:hypothetical protein